MASSACVSDLAVHATSARHTPGALRGDAVVERESRIDCEPIASAHARITPASMEGWGVERLPSDIRSAGEMGTFPIPRSTKFMRSPYKSDSSPPHYWISVGLSH